MPDHRPVRVAIVNDYELVVVGVAALLAPFEDRVQVVELDSRTPVRSDVDVVLYDTFGQPQADGLVIEDLLEGTKTAKVVVYSWNVEEKLQIAAREAGAMGYLSKGVTAEELVTALERAHAGEWNGPEQRAPSRDDVGRWPGDDLGLSARESEVLALICQGLSNEEICQHAFIGMNTVKTHIRHLYRKIDVARRSQAVVWGLHHGFAPDKVRTVLQ